MVRDGPQKCIYDKFTMSSSIMPLSTEKSSSTPPRALDQGFKTLDDINKSRKLASIFVNSGRSG